MIVGKYNPSFIEQAVRTVDKGVVVGLITPELDTERLGRQLKCYMNNGLQSHSLADALEEFILQGRISEEYYHDETVLRVKPDDKDPNIPEWQANLMSSGVINKRNTNRRK